MSKIKDNLKSWGMGLVFFTIGILILYANQEWFSNAFIGRVLGSFTAYGIIPIWLIIKSKEKKLDIHISLFFVIPLVFIVLTTCFYHKVFSLLG